jgi:O-acetyl-ADP-ribose deacetylase (regulator of RNase III)
MNKTQILHGDLLLSDETVIAHGCNARGRMGAGIAGQIAMRYPLVQHANQRDVKAGLFVPGVAQLVVVNPKLIVFNLCTQDEVGPRARLQWIDLAFRNMAERCVSDGITRVAIPQIGCGIGDLEWPDVDITINHALTDVHQRGFKLEVVCYTYKFPRGGK